MIRRNRSPNRQRRRSASPRQRRRRSASPRQRRRSARRRSPQASPRRRRRSPQGSPRQRRRSPQGSPRQRRRSGRQRRRSPQGSPRRRRRGRRRETVNPNIYVYCGNNQLYQHPDQNIQVEFGTTYRCLRKGFGAGYHGPLDDRMLEPYQPIDTRKIYCGIQENLPNGYDRIGNAPDCFQKGFASGKLKRALQENE